jgi:hypothetical protein
MRRLRRERYERHSDRCRERRTRHAGNDLRGDASRFERAKQRRQPGKIGEWISEHAESERAVAWGGFEALYETRDLFAAAAHEQRRVVDHSANDLDSVALEVSGQVGRGQQEDGSPDSAQRIEAADRQESGITRTQPSDANQHATEFGGALAAPP